MPLSSQISTHRLRASGITIHNNRHAETINQNHSPILKIILIFKFSFLPYCRDPIVNRKIMQKKGWLTKPKRSEQIHKNNEAIITSLNLKSYILNEVSKQFKGNYVYKTLTKQPNFQHSQFFYSSDEANTPKNSRQT